MLFEIAKHTDMCQSERATPAESDPDGGPLCFCFCFCVLLRACGGRKQKAHANAAKRKPHKSMHGSSLPSECALKFSLGDRPVLFGIEELCFRFGHFGLRIAQRRDVRSA